MNNVSKKNNSILKELIKKYPKKRSKLSFQLKKIFKDEYKTNRESKVISLFESWMHKNILKYKIRSNVRTLEIAGL